MRQQTFVNTLMVDIFTTCLNIFERYAYRYWCSLKTVEMRAIGTPFIE
jgi:hypothetical protein